ncbi:MAG TPA: hypothetical protein VKB25_01185 [Conexibacter sp.]|nr:hypothetical protein [Conexibacter sp.]
MKPRISGRARRLATITAATVATTAWLGIATAVASAHGAMGGA